jgi:hypothetical protein
MKKTVVVLLAVLSSLLTKAQWTDDPLLNTAVSTASGDQVIPHIAYTNDGHFYVGFFSYENGNYNVRLQYFDFNGNAQWTTGGILISNHTQNSWLSDWDLTTDSTGNCVLAFNDVRDGNPNVYAYKITPSGGFAWGADGIALTTATEDEYAPKICVNGSNNTIVVWERPASPHTQIVMQKIEPNGTLSWGSQGVIYQAGSQDYTGPVVLGLSGDNFLMAFYKQTGPSYSPTRYVYAQKFDGTGTAVWSSDAAASTAGGISAWTNLGIASDENGGLLISWHDDRNNDMKLQGYVQHVNSDGTIPWPANGAEVAGQGNFNHENVHIIGVNNSGDVVVVWDKYNGSQSEIAIQGQKFSSTGNRLWGSSGTEFVAMSPNTAGTVGGVMDGDNALVAYEEYIGGYVNRALKAFSVDESGNFNWTPNISDMSLRTSEKLHEDVTSLYNEQFIVVWEDNSTSRDIYMQNIFTDGNIGFPGLSDDATLSDLTVNGVTVDGFDPDTLHYYVGIPAGDPYVTGATPSDSNATVTITQAPAVPGQSTVYVLAEDTVTSLTYTIDFHVAGHDATLSDLTVNGVTIPGFDPDTLYYEYNVPNGDPIPVVGGTPTDSLATMVITQATAPDGQATIEVTSEDGDTTQTYTVNFIYDYNHDATLSDLTVGGITIPGFDPNVLNYDYGLVYNEPPLLVNGTPTDPYATLAVTQAQTVPDTAYLVVTADDGTTTLTYTVHFFYYGWDASLIDLLVNNQTINGFNPDTLNYEYPLLIGDTIPIVQGIPNDSLATVVNNQADSVPGNAVIVVTAEDSVHQRVYTVHFYYLGDDATLSDLTVNGVTIDNFDPLITFYQYDVYENDPLPVLDGTTTDTAATKVITQTDTVPGDGYILVTSQDSLHQTTYQVHFNLITSIKNNNDNNVLFYPNPTNGKLYLSDSYNKIELFSTTGKPVMKISGKNTNVLDISKLPEGVYILKIDKNNGETVTKHIVKE